MTDDLTANRMYKDTLFRTLFNDKVAALDLYNAINGTDYDNLDDVSITTLKDALYINMRNDVSCMIFNTMNLYEHQSTYNPNMPLRGLFYLTDLYRGYIVRNKLDIFSSVKLSLPYPKYVVFYNGTEEHPEREVQKLSDSFVWQENDNPALELTCVVLNINQGYNPALMEKCKILSEYSQLIARIRCNTGKGLQLEEAIRRAIHYCIENNILADFLRENSEVVRQMLLEEMDLLAIHEESERKLEQQKWYGKGRAAGHTEGRTVGDNQRLISAIEAMMNNIPTDLETACRYAGSTVEAYEAAKDYIQKINEVEN